MVPLFANFTKGIEKSGLVNGANITGSILKTGENMVDFYDEMFTFVKMLLTGIILMLVIVLAAMIILFLMENPNSPMAPVKLQNKLRFVADLEMRRMGNSPPEKEKQTGCIGVSVIST